MKLTEYLRKIANYLLTTSDKIDNLDLEIKNEIFVQKVTFGIYGLIIGFIAAKLNFPL